MKQQLLGLAYKEKNYKCKLCSSKNSEEDSVYIQSPVSIPVCVQLPLRENVWELVTGRVHLCESWHGISVTAGFAMKIFGTNGNAFLAFMYSHSICRDIATGQSCSYEQE